MSCVCPAILHGQIFDVGHYMQTVGPNLFIPAMLLGAIDFYHCMLLSLTLTLPGGHKVSTKPKPAVFVFSHTFHFIRMKFNLVVKQFKLNI